MTLVQNLRTKLRRRVANEYQARNLTITQLAKMLEIDVGMAYALAHNTSRPVDLDTLVDIAERLNCAVILQVPERDSPSRLFA